MSYLKEASEQHQLRGRALYFFGELATDFLLVRALSLLLFYLIGLSSFPPPLYFEPSHLFCTLIWHLCD